MSCLTPSNEAAYIRDLNCRVQRLDCLMCAWDVILMNKPVAPTTFAALLSARFAGDFFEGDSLTVVWSSTAGRTYQIQESPDGDNWFITSYAVTGTANTTTWVSGEVYPEGDRPFIRVLELPQGVICCSLPEIDQPPRFFMAVIGPTGGNPYGGCSDCSGNFDFCADDPLWTLT